VPQIEGEKKMRAIRLFGLSAAAVIFFAGQLPAGQVAASPALEHEDSKQLVALVKAGTQLVEERGVEAACKEFSVKESDWFVDDNYLFVLDTNGETLCHPARPSFEGRVQLDLKDPHGYPIVQTFIRELQGDNDEAWVHYLWPRPGESTFYWKTTYVRQARDSMCMNCIVGSGRYQMKMERHFVVEQVNDAVELIEARGEAAFDVFRRKGTGFRFYDNYVFVLDEAGVLLVNPGFPDQEGKNLIDLEDVHGREFVREMIDALQGADTAWIDYMWPKPGDEPASPKSAYIRWAELDGKRLLVGAGLYVY
jgi:signal transduction histidine kinase